MKHPSIFVDEISEPEHYIGCLPQYDKPYWAGLCDIPNGTEFLTADELVNATIYRGKSLKERWDDVRIICMGGIPVDDYMKLVINDRSFKSAINSLKRR